MKYTITINAFDLALKQNRIRLSLPGGVASVRVTACAGLGTWAAATLTVKKRPGGTASLAGIDFAPARVIPINGGDVMLSSSDLEACTEIEIKASTTDSAGVTCDIAIEVEVDGAGAPVATGTFGRIVGVAA